MILFHGKKILFYDARYSMKHNMFISYYHVYHIIHKIKYFYETNINYNLTCGTPFHHMHSIIEPEIRVTMNLTELGTKTKLQHTSLRDAIIISECTYMEVLRNGLYQRLFFKQNHKRKLTMRLLQCIPLAQFLANIIICMICTLYMRGGKD